MILQNPSALWGLLLLTIPIIVHLFDFRRVKQIAFSNVAFLQTIQKQNTPRRRLKELLILLARLLALGCLILAFAKPMLPIANQNFLAGENLIVIDNSQSMASPCDNISCLEAAKMVSIEVARSYDQGRFYYQGAFRLKHFVSAEELSQQLDELTYNKSAFDLEFEDAVLNKSQLTVISDFNREVLVEVDKLLTDSIPMLLVPINISANQNLYVDSVFLESPFSIGENKRVVGVQLANSGLVKIENALVKIFNDDRQLSSVAVTIEANASETIFFEIENSQNALYRVEVDDFEVDFDNDYYFTLPSFDPIKISIFGGEASRPIEAIFENTEYFDTEVYTGSTIDFERFFSSDLVIVHSLDRIPEWFDTDRLGGDLIVVPTAAVDLTNYSNRLGIRINISGDTIFNRLRPSTFENPFFNEIFSKPDSRVEFPRVTSQYSASGNGEVLLKSNLPYLQKFESDNSIYWFCSPLEDAYSELQNHALFLPIMYRIAENSKGFNDPLTYTLSNSPLEVPLENPSNKLLELVGPNGQFIPSSYYNQTTLILTPPMELNNPGFYFLTDGSDTLKVIAFNADREESIINGVDAENLAKRYQSHPYVKILESSTPESLQSSLSELSTGKQLWKYALLLGLMFLIAETALHRWEMK